MKRGKVGSSGGEKYIRGHKCLNPFIHFEDLMAAYESPFVTYGPLL